MTKRISRYEVIQYQITTRPVFVDLKSNMATWFAPYSLPVRHKRLPKSQIALTAPAFIQPPFVEPTLLTKWFRPLSEPKRFKPRLGTANNPALFWVQETFIEPPNYAKFNYPWSEPKRYRRNPRAQTALDAPFLAFSPQTAGETIYLDKWFAPFSEPKRFKPGLRAADHPFEFYVNLSFIFITPRNHGYIIV